MSDKIIWRLPIAKNNDICPVCGKPITGHKSCRVMITSPDRTKIAPYLCDALFCSTCKLPFANGGIGKIVRDTTGFWLNYFVPNEKCSVASIRNQMNCITSRHTPPKSAPKKKNGFELIPNTAVIWKAVQTICSLPENTRVCPKCQSVLHVEYTFVPVNKQQKAKILGQLCHVCETIYVENTSELMKIMRDNPLSKGFTLDGRELWNATVTERRERQEAAKRQREADRKERAYAKRLERKKHLETVPGSIVMIRTQTQNQVQEYIITSDNSISSNGNVFHYKSVEGLELLSAAFAKERDQKGILQGKPFRVINLIFASDHTRSFSKQLLPVNLTIKADGGYASSAINRNYEVVDLLLYSPLTQRYELIRGTHDKALNYCYTDIALFRNYVHQYGKPGITIDFPCNSHKKTIYSDLRSESVLMEYGYSVSEANHLSEPMRHEILSEIVDLEILTVHQIIQHLDFNCRSHSHDRYYGARMKWENDKRYIANYEVNPSRFLIAQIKK